MKKILFLVSLLIWLFNLKICTAEKNSFDCDHLTLQTSTFIHQCDSNQSDLMSVIESLMPDCDETQKLYRCFFEYDDESGLVSLIVDDGVSEDSKDLKEVSERHLTTMIIHHSGPFLGLPELIEEKILNKDEGTYDLLRCIYCTYNECGQLSAQQIFNASDNSTQEVFFNYDEWGNLANLCDDRGNREEFPSFEQFVSSTELHSPLISKEQINENGFLSGIWNRFCSFGGTCRETLSYVAGFLSNIKNDLSYTNYMDREWDNLADRIIGRGYLQFAGFYQHQATCGNFGHGKEISDQARITFINGILNVRPDLQLSMHQMSLAHGGADIHYVFRPTGGWTRDILNSLIVKLGYVSPQARMLAEIWKKLIDEMGGPEGNGKIIHYAHSIGGTETYAAKSLLTPEEQKMIHVVTLGSPTMIPDSGFASVINYVSKRDGVCLLDPLGYLKGWFTENSNVKFLGSFFGMPFVEHPLDTDSYTEIIKALGEDFLKRYGNKQGEIDDHKIQGK